MQREQDGSSVHDHAARLRWQGNRGGGTSGYAAYGRDYTISVAGKPDLHGSADAAFRGDGSRHNPEDLFLAALGACHMLFYLSQCARQGVRVLHYEDDVCGRLRSHGTGGGRFEVITLSPTVTVAAGTDVGLAERLHERAHELCFIANSCSVPVRCEATVRLEPAVAERRS